MEEKTVLTGSQEEIEELDAELEKDGQEDVAVADSANADVHDDNDEDLEYDDIDLPAFVMPDEPGLYEITEEDAQFLPCSLLDALFLNKLHAIDVLEHVGESVVVKFLDKAEDSDDMKKIQSKIEDVKVQLDKFRKERSVRSYQAKTIGCKKCGSQLAREFLKDDKCPLCGNDLRPASTIEQEAAFLARIDAYQKELTELEMINQVRNGQLHYLLRVV